ncbi:hypothetical protein AB4Y88_18840 [Paenarthrobacter sp. RAF9]
MNIGVLVIDLQIVTAQALFVASRFLLCFGDNFRCPGIGFGFVYSEVF